jgi:hypothetical protein
MIITVHQPKSRPNQDVYFTPMKAIVIKLAFTPGMTIKEQFAIAQKFNKGRSIYFN